MEDETDCNGKKTVLADERDSRMTEKRK
jgi:hypothetical protein